MVTSAIWNLIYSLYNLQISSLRNNCTFSRNGDYKWLIDCKLKNISLQSFLYLSNFILFKLFGFNINIHGSYYRHREINCYNYCFKYSNKYNIKWHYKFEIVKDYGKEAIMYRKDWCGKKVWDQSCSKLFKRLSRFVAKPTVDPVSKEKGLIQDALKMGRRKGPDTK